MKPTGVLALAATAGLARFAHGGYECSLNFPLSNAALKPGCVNGDGKYCEVQCDAGYNPTTEWLTHPLIWFHRKHLEGWFDRPLCKAY